MIKKFLTLFIVFSLFSCSSENELNEGNEISNITEQETKIKQDLILDKIKELGLDPNQVKFTGEHFSQDQIVVKSINDLDDVFKENKEFSNIDSLWDDNLIVLENNDLKENRFNNYNPGEFCNVYKNTTIPSSIYMNLQYQFAYSATNLYYREGEGIKDVSSFITGFVLGISYQQTGADVEMHMSGPYLSNLHELRIHGILNYNLVVEDIGTVYSRPVLTIVKFRLPFSKHTCEPSMLQAITVLR